MILALRSFLLPSLCLVSSLLALAQSKEPIVELQGKMVTEDTYENSALGLKITLPGRWHLPPQSATVSDPDPSCTGPLCGNSEISLAIESRPESDSHYKIYLAGWKLHAQYLDRNRYPLKWFAGIMMADSLGKDLVPIGKQTAIQLDGRPAYRLFAGRPGETTPRVLGYVSESSGYVFLLVGAAPTSPEVLQSAIEALKLQPSHH